MADEDNFDIDIYGDDANPEYVQENNGGEVKNENQEDSMVTESTYTRPHHDSATPQSTALANVKDELKTVDQENGKATNEVQQISSTGGSTQGQVQLPKQAPVQQGVKRKEGSDDRPTDPGATTALLINDLHWWQNEDDVRGWANQSGCEDELKEVTFNEHKVNGKSKGQVFVSLDTPQAATSLKRKIESFGQDQQNMKKPNVIYHAPHINPYRTLPKDVPNRKDANRSDNRSGSSNFSGNPAMGGNKLNSQGNFPGNRNFNQNRGGLNQMNFQNRNFSPSMGGMPGGGFNGQMGGGFGGNQMGGMPQFGNFNRGGMVGGIRGGMPNRGGRGGMTPGMMGMGMNGMNMNMGMGMGGNMNMGMGGMPGSFGGGAQPHFNPAFFNQGAQVGGSDNWNPHGAKRPRPDFGTKDGELMA